MPDESPALDEEQYFGFAWKQQRALCRTKGYVARLVPCELPYDDLAGVLLRPDLEISRGVLGEPRLKWNGGARKS